jgi:hypothetical protein
MYKTEVSDTGCFRLFLNLAQNLLIIPPSLNYYNNCCAINICSSQPIPYSHFTVIKKQIPVKGFVPEMFKLH